MKKKRMNFTKVMIAKAGFFLVLLMCICLSKEITVSAEENREFTVHGMNTDKAILISWAKQYSTEKYVVYEVNKETGEREKLARLDENSGCLRNIDYGESIYIEVEIVLEATQTTYKDGTETTKTIDNVVATTGVHKVTAKVPTPRPTVKRISSKVAKITWSKLKDVKKYEVYRSATKNGKYKKIKTTKANSYTDKKSPESKKYYYKIRAIAGKQKSGYSQPVTPIKAMKTDYKTGSVYGPALNSSQLAKVKQKAEAFKKKYIKKGMTEYQKVSAIHNYLCANVKYAASWAENSANTAYGALVNGSAQCSGFARAFKCLCDTVGIPAYYVREKSDNYEGQHQWVVANVENNWYVFDALTYSTYATSNNLHLYQNRYYNGDDKSKKVPAAPKTYTEIQKKYKYPVDWMYVQFITYSPW